MRVVSVLALVMCLGVAACAPSEDGNSEEQDSSTEAAPVESPSSSPVPKVFARSAWRSTAEDGARYTTFLDEGGTYRDLRNGDPWQTGEWTYAEGPGGKQLCFRPDDDNAVESCWRPGRMKGDTMIAAGPGERRIELLRTEYAAPETDGGETAE